MVTIDQTGCQHASQGRAITDTPDAFGCELILAVPLPDLRNELAGHDASAPQNPKPFQYDGGSDDGTDDDGQHQPSAGFKQLQHLGFPSVGRATGLSQTVETSGDEHGIPVAYAPESSFPS
jgi:hypothetical protein